uniref:Thyroid peroxidase-like n=1 Tax=Crassostrea virginica TaxID=6565 RepID=A0A8B8AEY0_CRAVI|nr:thyroid peroxidase-like [Crassostrea virginica]
MMIYLLLTILLCTVSNADEDFIDAIITSAEQEAYKVPPKTSTWDESSCLRGSKGNLLPSGGMCHLNDTGDFCQLGGDVNVNEVPSLSGLHVMWLRHNIIAKQIKYFSNMSSPNVYLETKKIVGALLQQTTYGEYLPLILSKKTRKSLDLDLKPWGYWKKYYRNVNPTVKNVVSRLPSNTDTHRTNPVSSCSSLPFMDFSKWTPRRSYG